MAENAAVGLVKGAGRRVAAPVKQGVLLADRSGSGRIGLACAHSHARRRRHPDKRQQSDQKDRKRRFCPTIFQDLVHPLTIP